MPAVSITIPLRWSDLDPQGHVNNVVVLDLAQEARARYMADGDHPELLTDGSVVAVQRSQFLHPMVLDAGPITVELGTTSVGVSRFVMDYRMHQGGRLCARVATAMCPFDFEQQRLARLSDGERASLAAIAVTGEPWERLAPLRLGQGSIDTHVAARWSDQDRYGHVNNVSILDWLQEARIDATTRMAPQMARAGMHADQPAPEQGTWVVVRQDTDYRRQLRWCSEPYLLRTGVLRVGNSSVTLGCAISSPEEDSAPDAGSARVRARTVLVHMGPGGHAERLSEQVRDQLESHLPR